MNNSNSIYTTLENESLRMFLTLLQLFYEECILSEAIVATTQHLEKLYLSDEMIHKVTGLPMSAPDLPKGAKLKREQAAQEYCKKIEDFSKSVIRIKGLKDLPTWQIAKLMALKLFGLQHPTYVPTHLLVAIMGVAAGNKYNWCRDMKLRIQKMLISISEAMKQASFFMPSFSLLSSCIQLWTISCQYHKVCNTSCYACMVQCVWVRCDGTHQHVVTWIEKIQLVAKSLKIDGKGVPVKVRKHKDSVMDLLHGQETSPREEREAKETRRRKGKNAANEVLDP
eukprot:Gb_06256 [translate_table: standard]